MNQEREDAMKNLIFSFLFLGLPYSILFSQTYERILHFDREEYLPADIPVGAEINGIQGITAGEDYLVIWNMNEFYIFDISDYQKINTVPTPTSIRQVVILRDKIYVWRKYNDIDIYTARGIHEKLQFHSYIPNYQQLKQLFNIEDEEKRELRENKRRRKRRKPGGVSLTEEAPWKPVDIRGIHNINGKIFLNIDWNYLELDEDFNREEHNSLVYLFLRKESVRNEDQFFFKGKFWYKKYPFPANKNKFEIFIKGVFSDTLLKQHIEIPNHKNKTLRVALPIHIDNSFLYFLCRWDYKANNELLSYTIYIKNINSKKFNEIILPDEPKLTSLLRNTFYYQCYFNSFVYKISYNNDESFDVLRIKVD